MGGALKNPGHWVFGTGRCGAPGFLGWGGCELVFLLGGWECRPWCLPRPRRHVFISRPLKNLGMDEEGVRQPSGPPTRKKFFIPLEEDEAPPAGVGRGYGEKAGRLGGRLRGRRTGTVLWPPVWIRKWDLGHLGKTPLLRKSVSLSVKCHGDSKRGLQAGTANRQALFYVAGTLVCKDFAIKKKVCAFWHVLVNGRS